MNHENMLRHMKDKKRENSLFTKVKSCLTSLINFCNEIVDLVVVRKAVGIV